MRRPVNLLLLILLTFLVLTNASLAFVCAAPVARNFFSRAVDVLPQSKIDEFVDLVQTEKGLKKVGQHLGDMKLSKGAIEDTYMRITVQQNKIGVDEASKMFKNLSGKEGFETTLRKVAGMNPAGTRGHLSELRLANEASEKGFDVVAIGRKFDDGKKAAATDLDVILKRKNMTIAIENKDYTDVALHNLDQFRGDMDSLAVFKQQNGTKVLPIFRMTNSPSDQNVVKALAHEAKKRGIEVVYGDSGTAIQQIKQLTLLYQ